MFSPHFLSDLIRVRFLSFIVIASSNEYARKILNSPTYTEPCLVASAKKVLCPDNWYVFISSSTACAP